MAIVELGLVERRQARPVDARRFRTAAARALPAEILAIWYSIIGLYGAVYFVFGPSTTSDVGLKVFKAYGPDVMLVAGLMLYSPLPYLARPAAERGIE